MEALQQLLAMLASVAGVLGVVVGFLQYKVSRQHAVTPAGPMPNDHHWQTSAVIPHEPPAPVKAVAVWAVLDALISVGLLFGLFTVVVANLGAYDVDVSALPAGVDITVVVVLTALVGAIKVPAAIRRGARLRHGVFGARTRLLGMAAVDLFFSVIVAAVALWGSEAWSIPDAVLSMVGAYVVFGIVGSVVYLTLLLHRNTRTWVERRGS